MHPDSAAPLSSSPDPASPDPIASIISRLYDVRTWRAFDIDDDGRVLAGWDDLGSIQLVEIDTDGTRTPLTALPGACQGRYVPGRRQVIVQHDRGGDENMQLSVLDLSLPPAIPVGLDGLTPLVADPAYIHTLMDVTATSLVYNTNRRNGVDFDVVVRDLATGEETRVYDAGGYVIETTISPDLRSAAVTQLTLRPSSTQITVTGPAVPGGALAVTSHDELAEHGDTAWSADGRSLIVSSNHDREYKGIARIDLDGLSWTWLVEDAAHELNVWVSPDASAMVVGRHEDGVFALAVHEIDGQHRCDLPLPPNGAPIVAWSPDSTRLAVTVLGPEVPGSIYTVDAVSGDARVVADSRQDGDPTAIGLLGDATVHRIPTPDGEEIPCFVFPPADGASADVAGASVINVHGGPEASAMRLFNPTIAALTAAGFTVLVPNVRGSSHYGKRWVGLDDVDLRLDSVADLAAIHAHLPELGLDPARSALWGGSYGGYMVLAGVAMQPDLWAAGVDIVGMSSLVTFLENTSAYRRAYREREYGSLEHDREFLEKASPITYLADIRAPLFVIHGANDPRVPLSEAQQIKAALDDKGVPCELRVYDDEGHGLAKRANRLDAYPAAITFLRHHLRP
ncbi:MAG: prolyl oligopeptidase family serine peptidase [Nocardioidaceae bacterium]